MNGAVTIAHPAALALKHRLTLITSDSGFVRFDGLRCVNLPHASGPELVVR